MEVEALLAAVTVVPGGDHHTNFYLGEGCCPLPPEAVPDRDSGDSGDTGSSVSRAGPEAGSSARLAALRGHVLARVQAPVVVVGEAAGWRGARRTGIAFTAPFDVNGTGMREPSATVLRSSLAAHGLLAEVLLWNACFLHPHRPGVGASNRAPARTARDACATALEMVVRDRFVIAVGRQAAQAVREVTGAPVVAADDAVTETSAVAVRHPSYGGAPTFRAEVAVVASLLAARPRTT